MLRIVLIVIACATTIGTACAQSDEAWPIRPIRFIVPFPSGGSTDAVARLVGQLLGARLRRHLVVENHSGAAGNIGTAAVARAAPEGYTIGLATTTTLVLALAARIRDETSTWRDVITTSGIKPE